MSPDRLKTRFPCKHGQWFRHPVDTKPPKWEWCEGGETKWLTNNNDTILAIAALWLAPHEQRLQAKDWLIDTLDRMWIENSPSGTSST